MSIYNLMNAQDAAYQEKMMHRIPPADVVEREIFILERVKGKTVLDIGATGPMHEAIVSLAARCYGIDIIPKEEQDYFQIDIDHADHLPPLENIDMIIAGEVIEHLSNAGHFLDLLLPYKCPVILSTPNAFAEVGFHYVKHRGIEQVNKEHVAYYSWQTLSVLIERHGFQIDEFHWYHGKPNLAEGMICLISSKTR